MEIRVAKAEVATNKAISPPLECPATRILPTGTLGIEQVVNLTGHLLRILAEPCSAARLADDHEALRFQGIQNAVIVILAVRPPSFRHRLRAYKRRSASPDRPCRETDGRPPLPKT